MKQTLVLAIITTALLIPAATLALSEHIEYNIIINSDGSALWHIIHVTDIESPLISSEEFEQKLYSIISGAQDNTTRQMELDLTSLEIKTEINWETSSKKSEYIFRWQNISNIKGNNLSIGDVFSNQFFINLFGDGELYITYPEEYALSTTSPTPNEHNNDLKQLHWYRTQDFTNDPYIELTQQNLISNADTATIVLVSSAGMGVVVIGVLVLNQKRKQRGSTSLTQPIEWQKSTDSKEEVLQLLRTTGGSIKQSEICNKLKYSRAKTSVLLTEMENNNQIMRDKVGKNKVVYLMKKEN